MRLLHRGYARFRPGSEVAFYNSLMNVLAEPLDGFAAGRYVPSVTAGQAIAGVSRRAGLLVRFDSREESPSSTGQDAG